MQKKGHKIELGILQDLVQISQDVTSSFVLQAYILKMHQDLEKSMQFVKEGQKRVQAGMVGAKELGDEKVIQALQRWEDTFKKFESKIKAKTAAIDKIEIF